MGKASCLYIESHTISKHKSNHLVKITIGLLDESHPLGDGHLIGQQVHTSQSTGYDTSTALSQVTIYGDGRRERDKGSGVLDLKIFGGRRILDGLHMTKPGSCYNIQYDGGDGALPEGCQLMRNDTKVGYGH